MMAMENGVPRMDSVLDTLRFVAWYADGFVCNSGPAAVGSLPGMVLEYDNGRVHYVATAFTPKTEKKAIVAPKGKRITAAAYRLLEADYRRRLMGERGMPPPPKK
jgi:GLPGLI family protein